MGGAVSAGANNEELVDNLVAASYITKPLVERVFRTVDRGHFFPEDNDSDEKLAYRDVAWRQGRVHISAPCIYCEVMENLNLKPGVSFLNVGSGTGYLSTMAGLMLGAYDTNHGIEIFQEMVEYSTRRVQEFMNNTNALDEFEFCKPHFICGNGLMLPPDSRYDRIYCGAACNEGEQLEYLKNLLTEGGILITPVNCDLIWFKKIDADHWESRILLPVSFALLLPVVNPYLVHPALPSSEPFSLQEGCRTRIRSILRQNVTKEHPELVDCKARRSQKLTRGKRKIQDESDDEWDRSRRTGVPRAKFDSGIVDDIDYSDCDSFDYDSESISDDSDMDESPLPPLLKEPPSPTFSDYMKQKLKFLPLPKPVLQYLNLERML